MAADADRMAAPAPPAAPTAEEKQWAVYCHLSAMLMYLTVIGGFVVPLVIWLAKRHEMPFLDDQGKETLNFQITILLALMGACVLMVVLIGFVLAAGLVLAHFVLTIVATAKAGEGVRYRYPFCWRVIS